MGSQSEVQYSDIFSMENKQRTLVLELTGRCQVRSALLAARACQGHQILDTSTQATAGGAGGRALSTFAPVKYGTCVRKITHLFKKWHICPAKQNNYLYQIWFFMIYTVLICLWNTLNLYIVSSHINYITFFVLFSTFFHRFCHKVFLVKSQFRWLSFVTRGRLGMPIKYKEPFKFLSLVTVWDFELWYNLCIFSFVQIWVFEYVTF